MGVLAISSICACKKDPKAEAEKEIAPFKAKAVAHVDALKKLAPAMAAAKRLTNDEVTLDGGPLSIGGAESFGVTAGLLYEEDLGDVEAWHSKELWPAPKAALFGQCGAVLKGGGFVAPHMLSRLVQNCADAKYVVMVRTLQRKAPVVREEAKLFTAGQQVGEVHVWNLETGKPLGGFRFSAKNDDSVKSRGISGKAEVERDLAINVEVAIEAGLKKFAR